MALDISRTGEEVFTTLNTYDDLDRPVSVTDSLGNTTQYRHDSRDALTLVKDPLGNVVRYEHDVYGTERLSVWR